MKTVRFHATGGPEVLRYEEVPDPKPGPGEVLVKVEAVGVNFADVLRRRGDDYPEPSPPPFTLGGEIAGTVAALGAGTTKLAVGDPVYATPRIGGYAQYVVVPAATVVPLPDGISPVEATTLVVQGLTAALALRHSARMAFGDTVLVEAAAGGVGSFAVQLARTWGASTVIGAASTPGKRASVLELGADMVVDYTQPGWADQIRSMTGGKGVDIILEMVGGEVVAQALDALAPFGRMVVYGQASGKPALVNPQRLVTDNQSVTGFYIGGFFRHPDIIERTLSELVALVGAGRLKLPVGTVLPLSEAVKAHRMLEGRQTIGKVVLQPWVDA
jgi:NADPH:quinone reductase